jgi:hypothetical protein
MRQALALGLAVVLAVPVLAAEETPVKATIRSVQLYKNGLAVVHQFVPVSAPGVYRIDDFATPVHGTLSLRGDVPASLRETIRQVDEPPASLSDYQHAFAGRAVTIYFREPNMPPAKGTIASLPKPKGDERWNRTYQQPSPYYYFGQPTPAAAPAPLVLKTSTGIEMVDAGQIARISADGSAPLQRERPVLLLTVAGEVKTPGQVEIIYLARGLSWAPAYRVDVLDDKNLVIEQLATIKNELADLADTDVQLISGFPGVRFAHVASPLALTQNWAGFFSQLSQPLTAPSALGVNAFNNIRQQARSGDEGAPVLATEGADLHYQSAGKQTLAEGESMQLAVAHAQTPYERIVEWTVPDQRDAQGRYQDIYQSQQDPEDNKDAWDSLRFANPLKFPMTTGPASVFVNGNFAGEQQSNWVDPGERTTVRITKALSIRTLSSEQEQPGERRVIWVGGHEYRQTTVKGELSVSNHRATAAKLLIRRHFSGEMLSADANPTVKLREEGAWSVNPRNELTWQFQLNPGEDRRLTYTYAVLVYN